MSEVLLYVCMSLPQKMKAMLVAMRINVNHTTQWSATLSHQTSTCLMQLMLGRCVAQIWSRNARASKTRVLHRVGMRYLAV